jgi:hypothetical protein
MFAELSYFLMPISFADTETFYQSCIQVWCHDFSLFVFGESKEKAFNGNWEQIYRAFVHFAYLKTYPLGLWYVNRLNAFEWVLNTPWTLVSVCGCLWVIVNSPWTPIECTWTPMSEWEQPLNTHWVHTNTIERVWKPIECAWTQLSRYWMGLTVAWPWERQHLRENWTAPECDRVHMNTFEWVLNLPWMPLSMCECLWGVWAAPEHPLSVHECLWVSILKVWMCTSRVVTLTSL